MEYKNKYYFYLNEINKNKIANLDVKEELNSLYNSIINSFITININKKKTPPLNLQNKKKFK